MNMDCLDYWKHARAQLEKVRLHDELKEIVTASRLPEIKVDAELIEPMTKAVEEIKRIPIPTFAPIRGMKV